MGPTSWSAPGETCDHSDVWWKGVLESALVTKKLQNPGPLSLTLKAVNAIVRDDHNCESSRGERWSLRLLGPSIVNVYRLDSEA